MNDTEKDIPLMVPLPAFIYGQSQEVRFLSLLILHQRRKNKDRTEGINLWNKLYHRADDAMFTVFYFPQITKPKEKYVKLKKNARGGNAL